MVTFIVRFGIDDGYGDNALGFILAALRIFASRLSDTGLSRTSIFFEITTQGMCCNEMVVKPRYGMFNELSNGDTGRIG